MNWQAMAKSTDLVGEMKRIGEIPMRTFARLCKSRRRHGMKFILNLFVPKMTLNMITAKNYGAQ